MSWFKKQVTESSNDLIKYAKNPELLKDLGQNRSEENQRYQEHKKKMKNL